MTRLDVTIVSVSSTEGGAERHTCALATEMTARGHHVALYGQCPGWPGLGLDAHALPLGPKWSKKTILPGLSRIPRERRLIAGIAGPSLSYLQFKREQITFTSVLARSSPVVWTEHGRWIGGAFGRAMLAAYGRAARHVARVVCVSAAVADDVARVVPRSKIIVIPNSVDTSTFSVTAEERVHNRSHLLPERFHGRVVAVLASRLHGAKRHDRAVAIALATRTPLIVIGQGADRARLERLAAGSPDVVFVGPQTDVRPWLSAADVYLYCGAPTDGLPTAVLEAAACGLGVLGFRGDPGTELVEACGGRLVERPADVTADLIASVAQTGDDAAKYVREHHGRQQWADAFESVFRDCTA